jgi:hypothetical protein
VKVNHLTLPDGGKGIQTRNGMLKGSLTSGAEVGGGYEMFYLSRLGLIEIMRDNWKVPVYISTTGCVFSCDEPLRKT